MPFYAILRSIPYKLPGVCAMVFAIFVLALLPWIHSTEIRSSRFRPLYKKLYWIFGACCFLLGWIGVMPVEPPYIFIGQCLSVYYFFHFLVILPLLGKLENFLLHYSV